MYQLRYIVNFLVHTHSIPDPAEAFRAVSDASRETLNCSDKGRRVWICRGFGNRGAFLTTRSGARPASGRGCRCSMSERAVFENLLDVSGTMEDGMDCDRRVVAFVEDQVRVRWEEDEGPAGEV